MIHEKPERKCAQCGNTYPLNTDHFFHDTSKPYTAFKYWCKACCIKSDKDWSTDNREARRAINRRSEQKRRAKAAR